MYKNLMAEMARHSVSRQNLAECLEVRYATVIDKLNGKSKLLLEEAESIKSKFFPDLSLEYLFKRDKLEN